MWLTRFSIQRPIITAMLFIALAVYGAMSYQKLGRSLNPNVTFPIVIVIASYPGASPEEMERLVIKPIEDQLDGIEHLDRVTATAQEGRAVIGVQFKLDTNLDFAAIDVQRRVDTARVFMPTDFGSADRRQECRRSAVADPRARPELEDALRHRPLRPGRPADRPRDQAHPGRAERRCAR